MKGGDLITRKEILFLFRRYELNAFRGQASDINMQSGGREAEF